MKLDIGGHRNPEPGYKILDIVQAEHVDYVCPAWDTPIEDGAVSEIRARHVFEHFSPYEAEKVLREWLRILKPGAHATVTVPNLKYHARQLTMPGMSEFLPHVSNYDHAINSIYGWQEHGYFMGHKWGYTEDTLISLFVNAGFNVKTLPCRECDIMLEAHKPCIQASA